MIGAEAHFLVSQLLGRLYGALDERDYDGVAACFDPTATWHRQGKLLHGREDIVTALQLRSKTLVVHHVYSNLQLEERVDQLVRARYLLTVYQVDPIGAPENGPLASTAPQVGWCDAELDMRSDSPLVVRMAARSPTFKAASAHG